MRTALCAVALVACGSSAPPVGPSNKAKAPSYEAALEDTLGFLPADSEIVVGIDGSQIRSTAVWAQFSGKVEKILADELADVRNACGFDPLQTVDRVSLGLRAEEPGRFTGVVVVRGVGAGTMGCIRTRMGKGGEVTDDRGIAIMEHHGEQSGWTMIGSTLIAQFAPHVSYDTMQAVLASGSPLRTSRVFMGLYSQLPHGASVWGVINGKTRLFDELDSSGMRPVTALGTVTMSDRIVIAGRAVFRDDATAGKVDALMKQSLAQLSKFTEHAESRQEGASVIVGMSISEAQLQLVFGFF